MCMHGLTVYFDIYDTVNAVYDVMYSMIYYRIWLMCVYDTMVIITKRPVYLYVCIIMSMYIIRIYIAVF